MRKLLLVLLLLAMSVSSVAMAESGPQLIIESGAQNIPDSVLADLRNSYPDAEVIHVIAWHDSTGENNTPPIVPYGWNYVDKKVTTTNTDVKLSDYFVISVAKGSQLTLSTEFNKTVSSSISVTVSAPGVSTPSATALGVSNSVTAKISVSKVFNGPPETSSANSREYRVRFYGDKGTWSCTAVWTVNPANRPTLSGTWQKPTRWAEYSVDKYIQ